MIQYQHEHCLTTFNYMICLFVFFFLFSPADQPRSYKMSRMGGEVTQLW